MNQHFRFYLLLLVTLLVVISFAAVTSASEDEQHNILVLHSYHSTYKWTEDISEGIIKEVSENGSQKVNVYFEFMDARRHPDPEYILLFERILIHKYQDIDLDAIIVSDDYAANFIASEGALKILGNIPVVYCGVSSLEPEWLENRAQATAVISKGDYAGTVDTILSVQPEIKNIVVVNDNISKTSAIMQKDIEKDLAVFTEEVDISYIGNVNSTELVSQISILPEDTAILLVMFNVDSSGKEYTVAEYTKMVSKSSNVPVYGVWEMNFEHGLVGGLLLSGKNEGRIAASIALEIVGGRSASSIPIFDDLHNQHMFNWEQMKMFSIEESKLPEGSIIINKKLTFYEQYRFWILATAFVLIIQVGSLSALSISRRRLRKVESELISARKKAENSERLKSSFLANMSHEIRTPINAILGFSEILVSNNAKIEKKMHYIELINRSGKNLLLIINDIVDLSRIESNDLKVPIAPFSVNKMLDDLYSVFSAKRVAESKIFDLVLIKGRESSDMIINSSEARISQIITNLLGNAFKFTEEGIIEFGYTLQDETILFYVKDDGMGIPKEKQEAIFKRFGQVGGADSKAYQGSGLGLTISRSLVELIGGRIGVTSEEETGSTFYFSLPLSQNKK